MSLQGVRPVQPIAPWLGGKRALSRRIGERIAAIPHTRYVEPFVGMGGVFFRRPARPKLEVINDVNRDVVNLFRILQRHYQQLLDVLKFQLYSRADFERLRGTPPTSSPTSNGPRASSTCRRQALAGWGARSGSITAGRAGASASWSRCWRRSMSGSRMC